MKFSITLRHADQEHTFTLESDKIPYDLLLLIQRSTEEVKKRIDETKTIEAFVLDFPILDQFNTRVENYRSAGWEET